jgi:hypothetical protein
MPASQTAPNLSDMLVWREDGFDPASYRGVQALAPILLGLALPAFALIYFVPGLAAYWGLILGLYLVLIFIVTAVIFIRAVFNPEIVAEVRFNRRTKIVDVTRKGSFGNTVTYVPFAAISDAYVHVRYDDDGYKYIEPRIRLKNGEDFSLPGDVSTADLEMVRRILAAA